MERTIVRQGIVACLVGIALLGACGSDQTATHAALADGCYINTDCNAPLVCAFRRCHAECETTRDCPGGARCVESDRPFHVCQLGVEKNCTYNSDCPQGQVCGVDQNCRDQCKSDSDCVPGQVCTQGTCAEPSELDGGKLTPVGGGSSGDSGASRGQPCQYSVDCPTPLICENQVCVSECKTDAVPTTAPGDGGPPTDVIGSNGTPMHLRAAANTNFAFVYGQWTTYYSAASATFAMTSASGGTLVAASTSIIPGLPLDIVAFGSGYVVLSQTQGALVMTQLSSTGTVLGTLSVRIWGGARGSSPRTRAGPSIV
jgi:hypothetical protein